MSKTLEERLHDAKTVLGRVGGAIMRHGGKLAPDVKTQFETIAAFASSVEHWNQMLAARQTARALLDDLEQQVDHNDDVPYGASMAKFQTVRLLGVQGYLAAQWPASEGRAARSQPGRSLRPACLAVALLPFIGGCGCCGVLHCDNIEDPHAECKVHCGDQKRCTSPADFDWDECIDVCEETLLGLPDDECYDNVLGVYMCLDGMSCEDLAAHAAGDPEGTDEYPCKSDDVDVLLACAE